MKKKLIAAATLLITGNVYAVTSSPFQLNTQADNISLSTSLGWLGGKVGGASLWTGSFWI